MLVLTRESSDGRVWHGRHVCLACDPDDNAERQAFDPGKDCPRCGGLGAYEWCWMPDLHPGQIPSAGRFPEGNEPPPTCSFYVIRLKRHAPD